MTTDDIDTPPPPRRRAAGGSGRKTTTAAAARRATARRTETLAQGAAPARRAAAKTAEGNPAKRPGSAAKATVKTSANGRPRARSGTTNDKASTARARRGGAKASPEETDRTPSTPTTEPLPGIPQPLIPPDLAATGQPPEPIGPPARETAVFSAGPVDLLTAEEERMFSRTTRWSFVLLVLLPVIVAAGYLFFLAADRYAVEVKFAVRSPTGLPSTDLLGLVTGGATGTTRSDAYMVVEYLQSRQFLDEVSSRLDLPVIYATDLADPLMRLATDASKEEQVDYLARVLHPSYDATAEIITVEAQAFTENDALRVASAVLETAEAMVNRLSEQARRDTVRLAEAELARAEAALKAQRAAIAAFRESEQSIDPNQTVATQENVLRDLQSQLATAQAEMRSLRAFLSSEAPSIRVLGSRIASLENQIAQERTNLGRGRADGEAAAAGSEEAVDTLNSVVTLYEALAVDLEFHERTYVSALSSLEAARLEADRQQRYLAAVVLPSLPESPTYPRIFLSLALVFSVCFFTWGIVSMFTHVIREHMR